MDIKSKFNISFISGKSLEYNAIQDPNISTEEKQELQDKIKQIHLKFSKREILSIIYSMWAWALSDRS